jgi:hypothetical protein
MKAISIILVISVILFVFSMVSLVKYLFTRKKKNFTLFISCLIASILFGVGIMLMSVLSIFGFVFGSFARVGMFSLSEFKYTYPCKEYNYTVHEYDEDQSVIGSRDLRKGIPDLVEIWYGIHSPFNEEEIIEPDGEKIIRYGPPFTFQICFFRLNHDIERIHFNALLLLNDSENDMLDLDDIYLNASYGFEYDYSVDEESDAVNIFKRTKNINIGRLVVLGRNEIMAKKYYSPVSEDERGERLEKGNLQSIIGFRNIPIDFRNDEEITIKIDLDIIMKSGEVKKIKIEDIYKRRYRESMMSSKTPPEAFGKRNK